MHVVIFWTFFQYSNDKNTLNEKLKN